mmetsp:Transcript_39261/g.28993  ORF Transcript_39261/g.28993 Transcript_39261/m.28993 type:complete len:84 (+) Transcript_39261:1111-1362(+)
MRNTIEDKEKLADKISDADKDKIKAALEDAQDWLNANDDAERDEYEEHLKELQAVCDPIISQIYKEQGGQGYGDYEDEDHEDL